MRGDDLTRVEASELIAHLLDQSATDAQIAAALVALAIKGETVEELAGMASAMRERAVKLTSQHRTFIDTAGTGSSKVKTFNVSTAAAFIISGAGLPVAKHGSRAATSKSGSADVLEALGVNTAAPPEVAQECLNTHGICFMFAPLYHGATARVAHVRRELGVHTTFNLLGPLTNPAHAPRQIIGVWHPSLVELVANALYISGVERAWVVHGTDGLDEISLHTETIVCETCRENICLDETDGEKGTRKFIVTPEDFGFTRRSLDTVRGGDANDNARLIRAVLHNQQGAQIDVARELVIINAAAALVVGNHATNLHHAVELATHSIASGAAQSKLEALIKTTNG